jgi:hypothetical protein
MKSKVILITIAAVLQLTSASFAALQLDQANDNDSIFTMGFGTRRNSKWAWQQFRPTMNNIEQVDIYLDNWNVPTGKVVSFAVQKDDGTTLWSTSFSSNIVPQTDWLSIDTPHISLVPENTYRLALTTNITRSETSSYDIIWLGTETGNLYDRGDSRFETNYPGFDYGFRTWATPEPATLLFLAIGAVMLRKKIKGPPPVIV